MDKDQYACNLATALKTPNLSIPNPFLDRLIAEKELETDIPKLIATASGTVLEVGPGSGTQLARYDVSKINRIYGVEPNVNLHDALRSSIKVSALSDIYSIIPCGVEDLEKLRGYGIEPGSIDTVISVSVLCSVPKPAPLVKDLYRLLKPGGQMIVYEHVRSTDSVTRLVQRMYISPYVLG